jgi:hypothetical protein
MGNIMSRSVRAAKVAAKGAESEIRIVVEVDGKPVGFLNLDLDRLWPLINHRKRDTAPAEWIDRSRFRTAVRAAVARNMTKRLESLMYQSLGNEIVTAQLNLETMVLKAEAAAQVFGRTKKDIEALAAKSGRTAADFQAFFWENLLDESESSDLKKHWKAAVKKAQQPKTSGRA